MKKYEGIFPDLLTPFDAQDKINEKELEIIAQDIDNPMKFLSRIESLE